MRLTAIGTSGSFPGPSSAASCYLLEAEDEGRTWRVVLDLGSGALGALQRHCRPADLDAVVLSHLHPDHCLDITGLYVHRTYDPESPSTSLLEIGPEAPARPRLPVWGPAGAERRLTAAHHTEPGLSPQADAAHPTDLSSVFEFHDIVPDARLEIGPFSIQAFLVDHPVEAYALRVTGPGGQVLTYSGDSDECPALVDAARGSDLFLCEAAFEDGRETVRGIHLTGSRAGSVAAQAGTHRLVLTHIPPWTDSGIVARSAAAQYPGPIELAAPGSVWELAEAQDGAGRPRAGHPTKTQDERSALTDEETP